MKQVVEKLNQALRESKISKAELAQKLNMSVSNFNKYCTGKREPRLKMLIRISLIVNKSIDFLLGYEEK